MKDIRIALAGNPNSGKTTAFNELTGARQHVGNYPGITVDKKEGEMTVGDARVLITDLPGTYSLTAYTQEELVARDVVINERPDLVVDVLNAGALERNLYLAVQFLEMGAPLVLTLNMMDEARKLGMKIDTRKLSTLLGVPVCEAVARTGEGLRDMIDTAIATAEAHHGKEWKPLAISYGSDVDPVLARMLECIESANFLPEYPARWLAIKYLEGDEAILGKGRAADSGVSSALELLVSELADHLQETLNTHPESVIADYRYGYINSLLRQGVVSRQAELENRLQYSDKMDKVLTHKVAGPLLMLGILFFVYFVTIEVAATPQGWVEDFFAWLHNTAHNALPDGLLQSLVVSGIIDGVGGVLGFTPLIMLMFLQIALLEDSGYMARVAYMLDKVFRMFGLHGCSVMPFVISGGIAGGCAVPGVMAARTLRSPREKLATVLTAPFMNCGAKLPVFILFVGVFFPNNQASTLFAITLVGWAAALIVSFVLRSTLIRGESTPFVMELPPYRMPTMRGLAIHTWERTWQYVKKAGTVILAISILLWAAMTFPQLSAEEVAGFETARQEVQLQFTEAGQAEALENALAQVNASEAERALEHSAAGRVGVALEGISSAAGFDWRTNIALLGGVAAKEVIVSTLGTSYSLGEVDPEDAGSLAERLAKDGTWTPSRAMALMLFVLLYAPCFVTVVMIKQESSWKWALFSVVFNTIFAFGIATMVFQIGKLL